MEIKKEYFSIPGFGKRLMMADLHRPVDVFPKGLVIYVHGISGFKDWGGMDFIAKDFARAGIAFLKFNFSHNGTTPECPEEFRDTEAFGNDNYRRRQYDLKCILDYTKSHAYLSGLDNIFLIGHSRGGTDVILYTSGNKRIKGLITWAAVAESRTPWRYWNEQELEEWRENGVRFLKNSRTGQELPVYYQLYQEYQKYWRELDVERAACHVKIPWLICHGSEDESVFVKDAYSLKQWQPEAQVFIVQDTGHTFGRSHPWETAELPKATRELVNRSIVFLNKVVSEI